MPIERTIKLYQFDELDDRARERAREWYRQGIEYDWGSDNVASLKAFADWFQVRIRDYSLGGSDNRSQGVKYELCCDDNLLGLSGVRLWKYFQNNPHMLPDLSGSCPFTGYYMDETLLNPIRAFLDKPTEGTTYEELIKDSIDEFCHAYAQDVDYQYSDEAVDESIEANEYTFLECGTRHE